MAKVFSAYHARYVLRKFREREPATTSEWSELSSVLARLPVEVEDALVVRGLAHDLRRRPYDTDGCSSLLSVRPPGGIAPNPARWASAVVAAARLVPQNPWARAYVAGLPEDPTEWSAHLRRIDEVHFACIGFWNNKRGSAAERAALIASYASDARVVAGLQSAALDLPYTRYEGAFWILAADGSLASLPSVHAYVTACEADELALHWLATDFAPLMTSPHVTPLRTHILEAWDARNAAASSPALRAAWLHSSGA